MVQRSTLGGVEGGEKTINYRGRGRDGGEGNTGKGCEGEGGRELRGEGM